MVAVSAGMASPGASVVGSGLMPSPSPADVVYTVTLAAPDADLLRLAVYALVIGFALLLVLSAGSLVAAGWRRA